MRRLTLNVDALAVETFEMDTGPAARGTVRGHDSDEALIPTTDWKTCRTCPIGCVGSQQPDTCGDICSNPCVTVYNEETVVAP
ncbi:MAG TPA: hypothetical protein VF705_11185 [Longimicrobium sp.]|jgi:hypothetical protein